MSNEEFVDHDPGDIRPNQSPANIEVKPDRAAKRSMRETMELRLVLFVMLLAAGAIIAYIIYFGLLESLPPGDPPSWAEFGDFFGGMVNPFVGIVTVLLVVQTLRTTRDEADETRKHLELQTKQMQLQVMHFERQQALSEIQKRLDGTLAAWNEIMSQRVHKVLRLLDGESTSNKPYDGTLGSILHEPGYDAAGGALPQRLGSDCAAIMEAAVRSSAVDARRVSSLLR